MPEDNIDRRSTAGHQRRIKLMGRVRHRRFPARTRPVPLWPLLAVLCAVWVSVTFREAGAQTVGDSWRGLVVAPEYRCAPYKRAEYLYPQSVELRIIDSMGGRIYGPYTGRHFECRTQTDIDHIVALSEAHDSGLCAADRETRRRFASDPLNLALAAPEVNRCGVGGKCAFDADEWLPRINRCWFANRVVEVRRRYRLTIDRREATALERVLAGCADFEMTVVASTGPVPCPDRSKARPATGADVVDALRLWDDNGNGRITCSEARRHRIAPVPREHPAYPYMRDGDGDGVVCE